MCDGIFYRSYASFIETYWVFCLVQFFSKPIKTFKNIFLLILFTIVSPSNYAVASKQILDIKFVNINFFKQQELFPVVKKFIGKEFNNNIKTEIADDINKKFLMDGYIFSFVQKCDFDGNNLLIYIIEGSINEIIIESKRRNHLVDYYCKKIKSIEPFNLYEANKYLVLLKNVSGVRRLNFYPQSLCKGDCKTNKIVNLVDLVDINLVDGSFKVDTRSKKSGSYQNLNDSYTASPGLYNFNIGFNNSLNYGESFITDFTTSGDKEIYGISPKIVLPVSYAGDKFEIFYSYQNQDRQDQYNYHMSGESFGILYKYPYFADFGITNFGIGLQEDIEKSKDKESVYMKSDISKFVMKLGFEKYSYDDYSIGSYANLYQSIKNSGTFQMNKFKKITYGLDMHKIIINGLWLHTSLNGQFSREKLPSSENFYAGNIKGGKWIYSTDIYGDKGNVVELEFYNIHKSNIPIFSGYREYAYVDYSHASKKYLNSNSKKESLTSLGVGVDFYTENDVTFNLEISKPIKKYSTYEYSNLNKDLKIFFGLEYRFYY